MDSCAGLKVDTTNDDSNRLLQFTEQYITCTYIYPTHHLIMPKSMYWQCDDTMKTKHRRAVKGT